MICMKHLVRSSVFAITSVVAVATSCFASGMPFPAAVNGKVFLQEKNSPYVLEQGVVVAALVGTVAELVDVEVDVGRIVHELDELARDGLQVDVDSKTWHKIVDKSVDK